MKSQGGNYKNSLNIRPGANLLYAVATRAGEQAFVFIINDTSGRANALAAGMEHMTLIEVHVVCVKLSMVRKPRPPQSRV